MGMKEGEGEGGACAVGSATGGGEGLESMIARGKISMLSADDDDAAEANDAAAAAAAEVDADETNDCTPCSVSSTPSRGNCAACCCCTTLQTTLSGSDPTGTPTYRTGTSPSNAPGNSSNPSMLMLQLSTSRQPLAAARSRHVQRWAAAARTKVAWGLPHCASRGRRRAGPHAAAAVQVIGRCRGAEEVRRE